MVVAKFKILKKNSGIDIDNLIMFTSEEVRTQQIKYLI